VVLNTINAFFATNKFLFSILQAKNESQKLQLKNNLYHHFQAMIILKFKIRH